MFISEKVKKAKPTISFEIFPPKKDGSLDTIYSTLDELKGLHPDFISVTYGAGGSTRGTTVEISSKVQNHYKLPALAHLTCLTSEKSEIDGVLDRLEASGVKNILALRGDAPQNSCLDFSNEFRYEHSTDLIRHIKDRGGFCIGAACYPEKHSESKNVWDDIVHLREKVDCGADFLITQLFFDNEIFYRFMEKSKSMGIDVPVIAGILPVVNKKQIDRIVSLTGCTFPKKFTRIIERYEHKPEALKEAGIAYATEQIIDLLSWGVDGVHIYTMNKSQETINILKSISTIRNVLGEVEAS